MMSIRASGFSWRPTSNWYFSRSVAFRVRKKIRVSHAPAPAAHEAAPKSPVTQIISFTLAHCDRLFFPFGPADDTDGYHQPEAEDVVSSAHQVNAIILARSTNTLVQGLHRLHEKRLAQSKAYGNLFRLPFIAAYPKRWRLPLCSPGVAGCIGKIKVNTSAACQ